MNIVLILRITVEYKQLANYQKLNKIYTMFTKGQYKSCNQQVRSAAGAPTSITGHRLSSHTTSSANAD